MKMIEVIVLNYKSHFCLFVSGSVISNYSSPLESEYTYYFFYQCQYADIKRTYMR